MGLFSRLFNPFIEVIEWVDPSNDTLVYRFPVANQEIKMGAQLIVRESQVAIFVNEGQVADLFEPGRYTLSTQNLPILTTLRSWKYGFNSPFKAEVYFINTRQFTDLKWGTAHPILLRDAEFGAVRLRAFGTYALRVTDPQTLMKEIVGTDGLFTVDEISGQLRNMVVAEFTDALAALKVPALDLAGNYSQLSSAIRTRVAERFAPFGLGIPSFVIENISLPPEVEKALDKRAGIGIVGDLGRFTQYQAASAIEKAAERGGTGATGLELGAGMAMGQQMAQAIGGAGAQPAPAASRTPETVACPSCTSPNAPSAKFCSECGARMSAAPTCAECGKQLPANAKFCPACGAAQAPAS